MFDGVDITKLPERRLRPLRRRMQLIPQDPYSAINPLHTIGEALMEPLMIHYGLERREALDRVLEMLGRVGLVPPEEFVNRKPNQLSGGQLQRAVIARAMLLNPDYVVADEPTSNLDASIRASIIDLLLEFRREYGQSLLFITHDISLVSLIADRVGVMYLGQLIEEGPTDQLIKEPLHPYTQALISAVPLSGELGYRKVTLKGEIGDPATPPPGCRFHPRCPFAMDICKRQEPPVVEVRPGIFVKCWLYVRK
jgi:peptide/nickel transport system ATP-binding protein